MSLGGTIGAVVGGFVGFFIGGPIGAAIGVGIGMSVGMVIDPISFDTPVGKPDISELSITTCSEGEVIFDLLGTSSMKGNILNYWGNRIVEVRETQETGGGGKGGGGGSSSQTVVTGYKYYLSWLQGFCIGPTDRLHTIKISDNVVWAGYLERPASGGQQTITLIDYSDDNANGTVLGSMTFYFGTDDHALNSLFASGLADSTMNIPYRNLCFGFFDDFYIGGYNRCPIIEATITKIPSFSFSYHYMINLFDYNAAHAIWYILTQMLEMPVNLIDTVSLKEVASDLYIENFGVSILFSQRAKASVYLDKILYAMGGFHYYDTDGKMKFKLLRANEDVFTMLSFDENDLLEDPSLSVATWKDTINVVKGAYPLRIETPPNTIYGTVYVYIIISPELEEYTIDYPSGAYNFVRTINPVDLIFISDAFSWDAYCSFVIGKNSNNEPAVNKLTNFGKEITYCAELNESDYGVSNRLAQTICRNNNNGDLFIFTSCIYGESIGPGVWFSDSLGDSWTRLGSTDVNIIPYSSVISYNENVILTTTTSEPTTRGFYLSKDYGETYTKLFSNYMQAVGSYSDTSGLVICSCYKYTTSFTRVILRSTDNGETWSEGVTGLSLSNYFCYFYGISSSYSLLCFKRESSTNLSIYYSNDYGASWTVAKSNFSFNNLRDVDFLSEVATIVGWPSPAYNMQVYTRSFVDFFIRINDYNGCIHFNYIG